MLKFNFKKKNFLINTQVIFGQLMPFVYFFDYFVKHKSLDRATLYLSHLYVIYFIASRLQWPPFCSRSGKTSVHE